MSGGNVALLGSCYVSCCKCRLCFRIVGVDATKVDPCLQNVFCASFGLLSGVLLLRHSYGGQLSLKL